MAVPDDRAQDLPHEASLDAVALTWVLLIAVVIEHHSLPQSLQATGVRRPLDRFAHLRAPIERRPKATFNAVGLSELQWAATILVRGVGIATQELPMLLDQVTVAALGLFAHEIVMGLLELLALAPCSDLLVSVIMLFLTIYLSMLFGQKVPRKRCPIYKQIM